METKLTPQAKRYQSQWASQFFVCAELTRRGYLVSITLGNAKYTDIHVETPEGNDFRVDVKGLLNKNNNWIVPNREPKPGRYYILVYLPPDYYCPSFYIGSSEAFMTLMAENKVMILAKGQKWDDNWAGFYMSSIESFKDRWDLLPK